MRVILGSSSPRRKTLLGQLISNFEIIVPDADESVQKNERAADYAQRVSGLKAANITGQISFSHEPFLVIACDTIVALDNAIIGKPQNHAHAVQMISSLEGRTHQVISSITLMLWEHNNHTTLTEAEYTDVTFKHLLASSIEQYLSRIHYMDKAGAYALQEYGDIIVDHVEGSRTNVIGFPLRRFFTMLSDLNVLHDILEDPANYKK